MNAVLRSIALVVLLSLALFMNTAAAEVTLSITISGTPDELIPLLKKLKGMGIGMEETAEATDTDAALRVHMHSVNEDISMVEEAEPESAAQENVAPLGLWGAAVSPPQARPGDTVVVTVQISDPKHEIDTVAASLDGENGYLFDLYDDGTYGDEVPNDGIWSYALKVPQSLDAESYTIAIVPYNRFGDQIVTAGATGVDEIVSSEVSLPVLR